MASGFLTGPVPANRLPAAHVTKKRVRLLQLFHLAEISQAVMVFSIHLYLTELLVADF